MNKNLSIYLDFLRFFAAIIVLISHLDFPCFFTFYPKYWINGLDAVMIFFVLSGYVIAYVADQKENNIKDYFISRFSRLYSVLIPALILCLIIDNIGHSVYPQIYGINFRNSILFFRFLSALTFTNQIWFNDSVFLSNGPLWSLSYEFWYYVLFAFIFYLKGFKKWAFAVLAILIMGPKILILAPIWGLGVLVYYAHKKIVFSQGKALAIFIFSLISLIFYLHIYHDIAHIIPHFYFLAEPWRFSVLFPSFYILGVIIALNIFSFKYI